jgi:alkylation response protein AidB-like acyl-CoA dehydrogenase
VSVLGLSQAELAPQALAAAVPRPVVRDRAADIDRGRAHPWDIVEVLKANGFMGMTIPKAYGGQDRGSGCSSLAVVRRRCRG